MSIMINAGGKMECLIAVASVLRNNFKHDDDVIKKIKTIYEYLPKVLTFQEPTENVRRVVAPD